MSDATATVANASTTSSSTGGEATAAGDNHLEQDDAEKKAKEEAMRKKKERLKAWQEAKKAKEEAAAATAMTVPSASVDSTEAPKTAEGASQAMDVQEKQDKNAKEVVDKLKFEKRNRFSFKDDDEDEKHTHVGHNDGDKNSNTIDDIFDKLPLSSPTKQNDNDNQDDDGVDPLDAFMSSLDGTVEQVGSNVTLSNSSSSSDEGTLEDFMADAGESGSNFITLEDIMKMGSGLGEGQANSDKKHLLGWESDSQMETDEQQEEREEEERRLFMEELRKKRSEEEQALEKEEKMKEQFGRVFAGEGDVLDEEAVHQKDMSALDILEQQRKGKEIRPVDHSTVEYLPFRKNLFIIPRSLARMKEEEVRKVREDLQIKVRGKMCPPPIESWEQCGLSERIMSVIEKSNYSAPFAVQKQAIPAIMAGRDIIAVAKTGSGKTIAFLLPMFRHILDQPRLRDGEGPIGLIMAPARELAFQINAEAKKFCKSIGLRVACIYGGANVADQIADLKRGADMVVCTPGRMIDILCMQAGKMVSFKRVTMVVMDEADRMFDMGFEPQIKMIVQNIRPDRQVVLFSATFPKQIEKLAKGVLKLPLEILVGERSTVNKDIKQFVEVHDEETKFLRLLQLLGIWNEKGSVLIFVDKQDKCDQLFQDLLKSGYPAVSLHGGKDQLDRDHTLHEFKTLIKTVMVATSVAGRGLDVPEIICVVNYNCPNHLEDYVHRVGRTGRAGRKGTAYTFISASEEQYAHLMVKALNKAKEPVSEELRALEESFKGKVERGEAKWAASGFDGKGFTFDAEEMNESQKLASMQRKAYEIEQGIDVDDEIAGELDEDDEEYTRAPPATTSTSDLTPTSSAGDTQLTPAQQAAKVAASLSGTNSSSASTSSTAGGSVSSAQGLAKAMAIANSMSQSAAKDANKNSFMVEFETNDYPPQARKKATQRSQLDEICDQTGCNIISRGVYKAPGSKLEPGERRLHLLIEGPSDIQVKQCKLEVQRRLDEETMKLSASSTGGTGRYSVL